ncbi:MAG: rhodanese-like domain-containing protein [Acidimicrobiia bacterium]
MTAQPRQAAPKNSTRKYVVFAIVGIAALVGLFFALGKPGMDDNTSKDSAAARTSQSDTTAALVELSPEAFEQAMTDADATVINVHIPYDGELAGTDAFVPYDTISAKDVPANKDATILLYCRSGRMSKIAGDKLIELGYTDVSHLTGGMIAWTESGRTLAAP